MPLYFAYGANMDEAAMAARCPRSRPLGVGRLARHRFVVLESGYASVVPDPRATVHGLLWDLALSDGPALDRFEEVGRGLYRKITQPVLRPPVGHARALVYIGCTTREGVAAPGYIEGVAASARALDFPAAYIAFLDNLSPARQRGPIAK
jgi:hypothetical protein